jgi:F0F1-type ATP synthase delta subunit
MEQKLIEHNSKEHITKYAKYLCAIVDENNILNSTLTEYLYQPDNKDSNIQKLLRQHNFDIEAFCKQLIENTSEFNDARHFVRNASEKIKIPLQKYFEIPV